MKIVNKCHYCGQMKELCEAHIIPYWTARYIKKKAMGKPLKLANTNEDYVKNSQKGIYDEEILCANCDNILGEFDGYAKTVFLDTNPSRHGAVKAWIFNGVDKEKIIKFFLSVAWRASISNLTEFDNFKLGRYEDQIKEYIKGNVEKLSEIQMFIIKYESGDNPDLANNLVLGPYSPKLDKINYAVISLPDSYQAYIKVDKRPLQDCFKLMEIKEGVGDMVVMSGGNYQESRSYQDVLKIVKHFN